MPLFGGNKEEKAMKKQEQKESLLRNIGLHLNDSTVDEMRMVNINDAFDAVDNLISANASTGDGSTHFYLRSIACQQMVLMRQNEEIIRLLGQIAGTKSDRGDQK